MGTIEKYFFWWQWHCIALLCFALLCSKATTIFCDVGGTYRGAWLLGMVGTVFLTQFGVPWKNL